MQVSEKEKKLIEILREWAIPYGTVPFWLYFQDNVMYRVVKKGEEESRLL